MDKTVSETTSNMKRGKPKITLDFDEFPPPKSEKKIQGQLSLNTERTAFLNVPEVAVYLSPIEENETLSTSGQSKFDFRFNKTTIQESNARKELTTDNDDVKYEHTRKYHTYPKSRIPVPRWSKERHFGNLTMDSRMYPLEPREIELEAFQQLHTADSQEELQEFLLLESQCSGHLGLATTNISTSEVSYEHHSEDERGTMSATQSIPRFIQEITDVYVNEGEKVVFECMYSGNPVPDVVWYKNDKLIMNTENVKIRILDQDKKTTLTVLKATLEDEATYVCKATSDIGLAITKAKLRVTGTDTDWKPLSEDETEEIVEVKQKKIPKKKKPELKKAKELKEKVKTERVKFDKKEIVKEELIGTEQPEDKKIVDIEETQILESATTFEETTKEVSRAKKIVPIQEPVITEATASMKKIDDRKPREKEWPQEKAKPVIEERESTLVVSEIRPEDVAPDFKVERTIDRAIEATTEIMETFSVSEVRTESDVQEMKRMETKQKKAKKVISQGQVEITQVKTEEILEEKPKKKKKGEKTKVREEITVEEILETEREHIAREVEEILEVLQAKEFGPGESPLRELATIGYLVRQGVSVTEINESLYTTDKFPALRTPDAQNALVQLVEREGHGPLISQVLTEETTTDESIVAATIGFRAFMRMIELQHATVEEVITHFVPEDFRPRAWEVTEVTEVETEQHVMERIDAVHKTEVHIMEYEDTRQAHTTLRKRKDRKPKDRIEDKPQDRDEGVQVVEIEEIQEIEKERKKKEDLEDIEEEIIVIEKDSKGRLIPKEKIDIVKKVKDKKEEEEEEIIEKEIIRKRKELKAKRPNIGEDEIQLEEVEEFEIKRDKSMPSVILNVPGQLHEVVPFNRTVEQAPGKPKVEKAQLAVDTVTALTEHLQPVQEKEIDSVDVKKPIEQKASVSISIVEPYSTTETNIQATAGEFKDTFKPSTYEATPGVTPSESLVVSEILTNDADLSDLTLSKPEIARTADTSLTLQEATTISETLVSQNEVPTEDFVSPLTAKAEDNFLPQVGLSVYEVQEGLVEDKLEIIKNVPTKPRVNVTATEPLIIEEVCAEDKPGKYYPELIVPTEVATQSIIAQKQRVTEELHAPEKEGEYVPGKLPPSQIAQIGISYDNETAIVQQNLIQESEGIFVPDRKTDTFEATDKITLLEGVTVSTVDTHQKEADLKLEENKTVQANLSVIEITSATTVETIASEKEQDYQPDEKPVTKLAETLISTLEIGSVTSTMVQESEGPYSSDHKPTVFLAETSVRPEEYLQVSQVQTADYPSDFKDELKYVSESGNLTVELAEAKMIHETLTHDKESKLEETIKPEERTVATTYDAMRGVEVFQTTSIEKEAELKIFELPESHHGKTVPTHPVVSLQIEETHPEDNVGEVIKEIPSSAVAAVGAVSLQETIVKETVIAEGLAPVKEDEVLDMKKAEIAIDEIESVHTTMVITSEKEAEYTTVSDVKGAFATTDFITHNAPISEEVRTESPTNEFLPQDRPASRTADESRIPLESISVEVQETAEKEDVYNIDVKPEQKIANVDYTEAKSGLSILEIVTHDKEMMYSPTEKTKDYTVQTSITGHAIALQSETLIQQSTGSIADEIPKTGKAIQQQEALEELIVTETNIAETGKPREMDLRPVEQSAEVEFCTRPETIMVSEITAMLNEEKLLIEEVPKERKVAMNISDTHEVAEIQETVVASNVNILKEDKPKEESATQEQSGLNIVQQTEISVSEKESPLEADVKPEIKKVGVTFEEGEGLEIVMTHPEEKEGEFTKESKPKSVEASVDIITQNVASKFEIMSDTDLSQLPIEPAKSAQSQTTFLPFETTISEQVETTEKEAPLSEIQPFNKKATLEFIMGESVIVSSVIPGDKESTLLAEEKPESKSVMLDIPTHVVAQTSETTTTDNIADFKPEEVTSATATTDHVTFRSLITSEISIGDKEQPLPTFVKPEDKMVNVTFDEEHGITIVETITSDKEKSYTPAALIEGEKAVPAFDAHKVAQQTEITPATHPDILDISAYTIAAAKEERLPFESIIQMETIISETEKEFKEKPVISNKAEIGINELISVTESTEVAAHKEAILEIPDKPIEKKAGVQIIGHPIAEKEEITVDLSVGKVEDSKILTVIATPSNVPLETIVTSEIQTTESEIPLSKDKLPMQATADLAVEEEQSIQVSTVITEDKENEYKPIEIPEVRKAGKTYVEGHTVAETMMQIVDYTTAELIKDKISMSTVKPEHIPLIPLIESQPIVQESEEQFLPTSIPENKIANVGLEYDRTTVTISQVTTIEKESIYVPEEQPSKHSALRGIDSGHGIAETTTITTEDSVGEVHVKKPDAKTAIPTQEVQQSLLITQDISQDQEAPFEGKFKPTTQEIQTSIEEGKRVTTVTEVNVSDKEDILTTFRDRSREAVPSIITGHEVAEKTEIITDLSTGKLDIIKPSSATAQIGQKPYETVQLTEEILGEKEIDTVEQVPLTSTKARVALDDNRFIAITEATVTQDVESELVLEKKPDEKTAIPSLDAKEVAEQLEINLREGLGTLPEAVKPAVLEAHRTQSILESINIDETIPQEQSSIISDKLELDKRSAEIGFVEEKSIIIDTVVTQDKEDIMIVPEYTHSTAQMKLTRIGMDVAETSELLIEQSTGSVKPFEKIEMKAHTKQDTLEPLIIEDIPSAESEGLFDEYSKTISTTANTMFEEGHSISVTEVTSAEIEESLQTKELATSQTASSTIITEHGMIETTLIESQVNIPEKDTDLSVTPQKATPHRDTFESIIVEQNLVEEREKTFEDIFKPSMQKADVDFQQNKPLQISEIITEDKEDVFNVAPKRQEVKATTEIGLFETVQKSLVEGVQNVEEIRKEEPISSQATLLQTPSEAVIETETTLGEREDTFEGKDFKPTEQTVKPQLEGLSTVTVTEVISNETEDILPVSTVPKEQKALANLLSKEAIETLQVLTVGSAADIMEHLKFEEKQTKVEVEELSSVSVSEIILNETEDTLLQKEVPKDQIAQFNISGREVAETTEVMINTETQDLSTEVPKEEKGKPGLEELTPLTVSQIVSNEAETSLPTAEMPSEKVAQPSLLGRDIAQTSQVFTMTSAEQLVSLQEPEKQKGKPRLEELSSLTVSQIISNELEETMPSPEVPTEREAQPNIFGRDVAQTMQVMTVTSVEQLLESKLPDEQKGNPSFEELSPLTISQILSNEMEDTLAELEKPSKKTAQTSFSGRDVAETSQILTMTSAEELSRLIKPGEQKGKPQLEELTSVLVSQVVSHESEDVLPSPEVPNKFMATSLLTGREVAETSQVLSMSNAEELEKLEIPKEQKGKPHFEELTSVSVCQIVSNESEKTLISPEKPGQKIAEPKLLTREVAEKTEIITVSTVEEMPKLEKPESQKRKPEVEELSSLVVSEVIFSEAEKTLPSPDVPTEFKAFPNMLSIEAAEISEVLTVTNVDQLEKAKLPEEQKGKPQLEELTSLSISEVATSEIEKDLPTPEEPIKQTALSSLFGRQVAQKSQVITSSTTESLTETIVPETKTIIPEQIPYETFEEMQTVPQESERNLVIDKTISLATAEVTFRTSESFEVTQIMTTEKESKQEDKETIKEVSALPDVVKTEVALKTEVLVEDTTTEFKISKPESKKARELEEPRESIIVTELGNVGECESVLLESVMPLTKVANVSIEADRLTNVIETTEAPVQHDTKITLPHKTKHDITTQPSVESDTEVIEEYTTKFRRGSKDEDSAAIKTKKTIIRKKKPTLGKEEENIVVIEEELENIKSTLPQIPKKQFMSIEEITDVVNEEEIIPSKIEEIEEIPLDDKIQSKKKQDKESYVTEVTVEKPGEISIRKAAKIQKDEEFTEDQILIRPKKKNVTEKTEIVESVQAKEIIPEPMTQEMHEEIIMIVETPEKKQNIAEITETPTRKVIKKKKTRITQSGVPEEVVEEFVIEKPKEEQAIPLLEEREKQKEEMPEVIEVIETPTTKIVKRKKKPIKKGEPTVITEEIIQKTADEVQLMEEQK
ncbi:hypothetical protein M0802_014592, partial [Mischocyttarus mexicanus]